MNDGVKSQLNILINAVARGDPEGLDGIYELAGKRMFIAALSIVGDKSSAEDVVSDSFIKIVRFAHKYRTGDEPLGWILRIVRNTALDFLRKRKRRTEVSTEEFFSLTDDSYSPEKRETAVLLEQAMDKLAPDERRAVYMRYYLDMTVREIASAMKLSRSAAERLLQRAEANLKSLLT